jgi:hypothetical protein
MHLMGGSVYAPTEQQLIVSLPVQHTLREKWQALGAKLYFLAKHYPRPDKFVRKLFECF